MFMTGCVVLVIVTNKHNIHNIMILKVSC